MIVRMKSAAKASDVRDCDDDVRIRYPSPDSEPTNSPITAPITAKVIAILRPDENMRHRGRETHLREYLILRMRTGSGSVPCTGGETEVSPVAVETTIGKKQTRNTTTIFGRFQTRSKARAEEPPQLSERTAAPAAAGKWSFAEAAKRLRAPPAVCQARSQTRTRSAFHSSVTKLCIESSARQSTIASTIALGAGNSHSGIHEIARARLPGERGERAKVTAGAE